MAWWVFIMGLEAKKCYETAGTHCKNSKERIGVQEEYHSDYRTVSPYWVLPVYDEFIQAVRADDGDRPLLF
jgi:hypothetical protein